MTLSTQQWKNARAYIKLYARPLEQKLYCFYFEDGSMDDVIQELSSFQNEDGGFGQAIEPDFRLKGSSPLATTIGLQIAKNLALPANHPMIKRAMDYLNNTYSEELQGWNAVSETVNTVPHAPWWHFDHHKGHCGVQATWANPNAEIVGYFHKYFPLHPRLTEWTDKALQELSDLSIPLEMHDFLCYQRLSQELSGEKKKNVLAFLISNVRNTVCTDPSKWDQYVAKPLQIAGDPSSPFYESLKEEIQMQLNWESENQCPEGYWQPKWSWFGQYEDEWKVAETEWRGILTLNMLRIFRAYRLIPTP
ncbi:hypothetical protein [Rossellomorea sp. YZS02]|uniref:hypothetical protein n=1 Tax=Rossellomorea sp. YZS02 TaxID=3097358 RepID=UPI002A17F205|nr:hypothetical protein [Rossellomorea sp. YZS02]MDX8343643.1 hypothetical protein [Rossellomorea sp. YZS02]